MIRTLFCVCLFLVGKFVIAQDENATWSDVAMHQEVVVEPTELVCSVCGCEGAAVDCQGRGLQAAFTLGDWEGLKNFTPTEVDLSNNQLVTLTPIGELPIQILNVSYCELNKVSWFAFKNLESLVTLDLSHNRMSTSSLSRMIFDRGPPIHGQEMKAMFQNLRTLSLAYNDIHSLPQDLFFAMAEMTSLDLSGNPLAFIDQVTMAAITELVKLTELKMSSCDLETLPEGFFRRQRRLEKLDLSDNSFTTIPAVLSEAVNLVHLNFNKNPIEEITEQTALSSLTKLQELQLCRLSKLRSITEGSLGGLESLVSLHLCFNPRLTTLEAGFLMWIDDMDLERYPLLEKFYLQSNNLTEINSHYLERWDRLTEVDFTSNPYECDCDAQWMVDVLVPLIAGTTFNTSADNMFCKKPQELRGMSFSQLYAQTKTLPCPESMDSNIGPAPDSAIILGIMIGIFSTFPIVFILVLLWRKGYFAKCRRKVIKNKEDCDDEETDAF